MHNFLYVIGLSCRVLVCALSIRDGRSLLCPQNVGCCYYLLNVVYVAMKKKFIDIMKFAASFARGIKRFRGPDVAPTPTLVLNNLLHLDPHCHCYMSKSFSCPLHLGVPIHDKNNISQFYFFHFSLSHQKYTRVLPKHLLLCETCAE